MPSAVPLFPLNATLVPGLMMPLHIFEPRYRALVQDLMSIEDADAREFGIIAIRDGHDADAEGMGALHAVGTMALLREVVELDDGRFDIVTTGSRRFRLLDVDSSASLLSGEVEFLEERQGPGAFESAAAAALLFERYRHVLARQLGGEPAQEAMPTDPVIVSHLISAAMILPTDERQELLAAPDAAARLARASELLIREITLLTELSAVPAVELWSPPPSAN